MEGTYFYIFILTFDKISFSQDFDWLLAFRGPVRQPGPSPLHREDPCGGHLRGHPQGRLHGQGGECRPARGGR